MHEPCQDRRKVGVFYADVDIKGFFDNIPPHHLLMTSIAAKIADGNILNLIERFLNSGVMKGGKITPTTKGTCQGGVITIKMTFFKMDEWIRKRIRCMRYKRISRVDN